MAFKKGHKGFVSKEGYKRASDKRRGVPLSDTRKQHLSEAMIRIGKVPPSQKGVKRSDSTKELLRISHLGHIPSNKGKKWPEISGEKHWNWKGGVTPENIKIRNSLEIKLWRDAVFARDGYTCQKTGIKGCKLTAHHIENFANSTQLRTAISNGITLSEKSHIEFHKKYGRSNNTLEQLQEFLTAQK